MIYNNVLSIICALFSHHTATSLDCWLFSNDQWKGGVQRTKSTTEGQVITSLYYKIIKTDRIKWYTQIYHVCLISFLWVLWHDICHFSCLLTWWAQQGFSIQLLKSNITMVSTAYQFEVTEVNIFQVVLLSFISILSAWKNYMLYIISHLAS